MKNHKTSAKTLNETFTKKERGHHILNRKISKNTMPKESTKKLSLMVQN